jgi:hypothetical protein
MSNAPKTNNPFRYFHELGWTRLLPLYPADAKVAGAENLSEDTLNQRLGKAPALRMRDGQWINFRGWALHKAADSDLDLWHGWGANVGFCLEKQWLVFDIDILDAQWADRAEQIITEQLGLAPCRIGRAPKRMLFYRTSEPISPGAPVYTTTAEGDEMIEMFGQGRNVALFGTHRKAGKAMAWPRHPVAFEDLPVVTPEAFNACVSALLAALPEGSRARSAATAADREAIDQEGLRARNVDTLKSAVSAIRNTRKDFGGYDEWVRLAAAIRAAVGPEGFYEGDAIFADFSERSDIASETEDPGRVYRSVNPPFAVGAKYVYDMAVRHGWDDSAAIGAEYFDPIPESEPSPFDTQTSSEQQQTEEDTFPVLRLADIENRPPPAFLIDRHIPQVSTGFLYSAPGIGKSFLALDMALTLAFGQGAWHGDPIDKGQDNPCVLYLAAEGSFGFRNRIRAWRSARNIPQDAPDTFVMIERSIDFMHEADIAKLIRTVRRAVQRRPCLVVVDTVSRAMPGADENLQKEMTLFVRACDRVKDAFQCAVLGVHHAGKSGDMRGSTVLRGAGDFVFKLERAKGASIGQLTCEKQKDAPDGWTEPYAFEKVALDDGQSSLVAGRAALPGGRSGPMTPSSAMLVLGGMKAAWDAGEPWGKTRRAGVNYAADRMVRDYGLTAEQAESYLDLWLRDGTVALAEVSRKTKRVGYQVLRPLQEGEGHFSPVEYGAYDEHTNHDSVFD